MKKSLPFHPPTKRRFDPHLVPGSFWVFGGACESGPKQEADKADGTTDWKKRMENWSLLLCGSLISYPLGVAKENESHAFGFGGDVQEVRRGERKIRRAQG